MAALVAKLVWDSICDDHLGKREGPRGSAMVLFEIAMAVSYMLSMVSIALSAGRNLPSNVSDGGGSLCGHIWVGRGDRCKLNFNVNY